MKKPKRIGSFRFRVEVWGWEKDRSLVRKCNWYWHLVAQRNGKIVADGAEGYRSLQAATRMIHAQYGEAWPIVVILQDGSRELLPPPSRGRK